ncbi:hypothetical protein ABVT39_025269 [Epinephelus coioides]
MSVEFCLALLALSSLTAASDPGCEELLKPLEDQRQVSGKWIFHAATSDSEEMMKSVRTLDSSWIELSPKPDSDDMILRWGDKVNGKCVRGSLNATSMGNATRVTFHLNASDHVHVGKYLTTCPDCILWTDTSVTVGKVGDTKSLLIYTKFGKLNDSDLEVFKKQAACLNLPPEYHFGESTDLCPDENVAATDVKEE